MSASMNHCPQTGSLRGGDFSSSQVGKHLQNNTSRNRRARTGNPGGHTNAAKPKAQPAARTARKETNNNMHPNRFQKGRMCGRPVRDAKHPAHS